ncbi:CPBP family intramembrane glutamic endopeptidase [Aporhodopirellula aestuarii]|uniref:CPBP family intramembrane metalloprotease n=1 Tax=Aporhodopirellula aestuarii TaxID=2950107 RepID=A0ABT0U759_9BACT|nr:type II CAAX endopeptidase family protein [Aporhodopirellula aestuarii]MCM2372735.1 CPBP family intramembrane metalloprotease [Aporhodopirellula aestuarii]
MSEVNVTARTVSEDASCPNDMPSYVLPIFFFITFLITWGTVGLYIVFPEFATARLGQISGSHPAFFLATWSPGISAIPLVLLYGGIAGLKGFLSRLCLWRCSPYWVVFTAIGLPLVFATGSLIKGGPLLAPVPPEGVGAVLATLAIMLFLGPIEEFGWRGVAQPLLQRHFAPLWAGVIIGVVWGIWHLPAFYLAGTLQSGWSFTPFFIGNVVLAVIVTPLFNSTHGSILWPMLFHWQLINPLWADAQPFDTYLLVAVAAAVVYFNRDSTLNRGGVTEVMPSTRGKMP